MSDKKIQENSAENLPEHSSAPDDPPSYEGYQNLGFVNPVQAEAFDFSQGENLPRPTFQNVPFLSENEAKEAFATFVSEHCCYGTAPVKELKFTSLNSSNSFKYILQTFTETRSTSYVSESYSGAPIYMNGRPPQPWEIPCQPSSLFTDEIRKIEIPNTSVVQNCNGCGGIGSRMCWSCTGSGRTRCGSCGGSGNVTTTHTTNTGGNYGTSVNDSGHHEHHSHSHVHHSTCSSCRGSGFQGCWTCSRTGRVRCDRCLGSGKLRFFIQLTVTYKNNKDIFLKKNVDIPDDLMRDCQGHNIYSEQNKRLYPIQHHNEPEINRASFDLINSHASKYSSTNILCQKHDIYSIPVTNCYYDFKEKSFLFQVYGTDLKVYAPDYPRKCCCCTIL